MGFEQLGVEVVKVETPEAARAIASKINSYGSSDSERDPIPARKQHIKTKILAGEMTTFDWAYGVVKGSGERRRTNGQHSSLTFLEMTPEEWAVVRFPLFVALSSYSCDSMEDIAVLFEQFDAGWSKRSNEDLVGVHVGIHEDLRNAIDRKVSNKVSDGIVWYYKRVLKQPVTDETKFQLFHDQLNHPFLIWCGSFLQKDKTREMLLPPIIAAVYHTTRDGNDKAKSFWKRVAIGKAALDADSIEYKLAAYFEMLADSQCDWPRSIARHFSKTSKHPSSFDTFATCLRAFNGWKMGTRVGEVFTPAKTKDAAKIVEELSFALKVA